MQLEGKAGLSILEACDAARVSRAGFYRRFDEHLPRQAYTELRQQIQQICLAISVIREDELACIAALSNMMWDRNSDHTGQTRRASSLTTLVRSRARRCTRHDKTTEKTMNPACSAADGSSS